MKHLGMFEGESELPERTLPFKKRFHIKHKFGGLLIAKRPLGRVMRKVEAREVSAMVVSNTFER